MTRSSTHKQKTRQRILTSAAQQLRIHGYDGVSIENLMSAANLTRGGFYAHFSSKRDLFIHIVRDENPLLKLLMRREGDDPHLLWQQMLAIFDNYLNPDYIDRVVHGCTLAALSGDVARASEAVQEAFEETVNAILAEMARGQSFDAQEPGLICALVLAVGSVSMAAALPPGWHRAQILDAAHGQFLILLEGVADEQEA